MTAYIFALKFLQVSVKSIAHFKIMIALYMPVFFFKHCHKVDSINSISVDTDPTDVCKDIFYFNSVMLYYGQFYKSTFTVVKGLNIINYLICNFKVNHTFSVIS